MIKGGAIARVIAATAISAAATGALLVVPGAVVDEFRPSNVEAVPLTSEVGQSFVAPADRLSSVGFFISFSEEFPESASVLFELSPEGSQAPIRRAARELRRPLRIPYDITRPTYFDFRPVEASQSKAFRAVVRARASGIGAFRSGGDADPRGSAYVSGEPQPFDLALATAHEGSFGERLARPSRRAPAAVVPVVVVMGALGVLAAAAGRGAFAR